MALLFQKVHKNSSHFPKIPAQQQLIGRENLVGWVERVERGPKKSVGRETGVAGEFGGHRRDDERGPPVFFV